MINDVYIYKYIYMIYICIISIRYKSTSLITEGANKLAKLGRESLASPAISSQ